MSLVAWLLINLKPTMLTSQRNAASTQDSSSPRALPAAAPLALVARAGLTETANQHNLICKLSPLERVWRVRLTNVAVQCLCYPRVATCPHHSLAPLRASPSRRAARSAAHNSHMSLGGYDHRRCRDPSPTDTCNAN